MICAFAGSDSVSDYDSGTRSLSEYDCDPQKLIQDFHKLCSALVSPDSSLESRTSGSLDVPDRGCSRSEIVRSVPRRGSLRVFAQQVTRYQILRGRESLAYAPRIC
jgi:hypothetical protein